MFLSATHKLSLTSSTCTFQNAPDGTSHTEICPLVDKVGPGLDYQFKTLWGCISEIIFKKKKDVTKIGIFISLEAWEFIVLFLT